MQYEQRSQSNSYRANYLDSVRKLVEKKQAAAYADREEFAKDLAKNQEAYREKYIKMLGWPLTEKRPENINVKITKVDLERDFEVYRMEFEIFEDFWFYGMFFKQKDDEKRPFVISQHGGLGTVEWCSGILGDTANYNGMTERIIAMGANVFAPQLLLWDMTDEGNNIDDVRRKIDNDLKQLGGSITALEVYCIQTVIDYFEKKEYVDKDNIVMAGLSYGGFYTQMTTAADPRIKRALAAAQFNDRIVYNWSDWTWFNSANTFTDAEIAMLIYPRKFTVCLGDNDDLFAFSHAEAEYERFKKLAAPIGDDWLDFVKFEGTHEFIKDDEILKKALFE